MRRIGLIASLFVALFAMAPPAFADCTQVGPLGDCPTSSPTPSPSPANGSGGQQSQQDDPVAIERDFFNRINRERANRGLSRLSYHADLTGVARRHSARMAQEGRLYHNTAELRSDDFHRRMGNPQMVGENVGEGPSVNWLHDAFMGSTGHRANILEPRYTALGVGVVVQGDTIWVTQDFIQGGSRRSVRREFPAVSVRTRRIPPAPGPVKPAAIQPAVRPQAAAIRPRPIAPRISALRLPPIPAPIPDEPAQSPRPLLPLAALATLSAVAFASRKDAAAWI